MAGKRTLFVHFDPSKAQRTGSDRRTSRSDNLCQICFKPFDTSQALRDHIGDFQLEVQQLTARMLEAQAHLPSLENQHHAVSNCNREACYGDNDDGGGTDNDEGDDGDDDDAGNGDCSLGWENHARLQCPYPICDREKQFNKRQDLLRHFQLHVQCYETCVFCRDSFNRVRPFLRHQCKAKTRGDEAKEFYMRERCAQLRRYATETLRQMLAREDTSHERTRKRGHGVLDECSERPSSGIATVDGDADRWFPVEDNLLGVLSRSSVHNFTQQTLMPSLPNGPTTPASNFFNAGFAPIFGDITITPCYDQLFSSNTLNGDYPAVSPLETPGHILQAPAPEHQGSYGQTNSGTEAIPY